MNGVSAVVCVWAGDDAEEFSVAVRSLLNQTRTPDEILLVEDGPLTADLNDAISGIEDSTEVPIRRVAHPTNRGHGAARRTAIEEASFDLIAIHDADDIAVPERLERSVEKMHATDADLVGGYIEEFDADPDTPNARREVPCDPADIRSMAKIRSPVNHTTVLARREAILAAGNYRSVGQMEDYELWARMLVNGCKFVNIPEVLAKVRAGEEMYRRRGGLNHVREELRLQRHFVEIGFVSVLGATANLLVRSVPKLLPNRFRERLYTTLFREKASDR